VPWTLRVKVESSRSSDKRRTDNVIAVLGANSAAAVEMTAIKLKTGDPSYAGPLAGVALGIPSYHILEPEIVGQIDPAVYERELALSALAMDVDEVIARP
jgi:glycine/sarcosine/betaine reductase complex component A